MIVLTRYSTNFMMKYLQNSLLLLSCLLFGNARAQGVEHDLYIWNFQKGGFSYVFASKANVRIAPSVTAPVKDSLPAGTKLSIAEVADGLETHNGFSAPWLKVKYRTATDSAEGYIWGGLMAIAVSNYNNITYLNGVHHMRSATAIESLQNPKLTIGLREVIDGAVKKEITWLVPLDESFSFTEMKLLGNPGLENVQNVVRIMYSGEACGVPANYYYYGVNEKDLLPLPTKMNVGDAGVYYHSESLLFPNEKGGKPGKIVKFTEETELLQEATATKKEKWKTRTKYETYIWDGQKALKILR